MAFGVRANGVEARVRRGPARAAEERREEVVGRASREAERRNTIVNVYMYVCLCEKLKEVASAVVYVAVAGRADTLCTCI